MVSRKTRLKVKRHVKKHKKNFFVFSEFANKQLDRHFFRRWHNMRGASRFTIGWILLLVILIVSVIIQTKMLGNYYLFNSPTAGGIYSEGMVGTFSGCNPIYATTNADLSISKLVFASLLKYDNNNQLVGDLAESWNVDTKGTTYTIKLKSNLLWQDGQPLTADDVVYTFKTIQNPDSKSPLLTNWTGIKIERVDKLTVKFILPTIYSPFAYSLTTGIVPQHILKEIPPAQLRGSTFNTEKPVGAGPFKWKTINIFGVDLSDKTEIIQLVKFDNYHSSSAKLNGISINLYPNVDDLKKALQSNTVIAASGLSLPEDEIKKNQFDYEYSLMTANMLFFKTTAPLLSDQKLRQALIKGTNTNLILTNLGYKAASVREPLLKGQLGYDPKLIQQEFNEAEAKNILDADGWVVPNGENYRKKDGQTLVLKLKYDVSNPEYQKIAEEIKKQWSKIGVNVEITNDEKQTQKLLDTHDYDILLYGINIGVDPDIYAYWHSSQIDKRLPVHLNLSEYKSRTADLALEAARTRTDAKVRAAKYKAFLEAWKNDVPAIGLYQSRYQVVSNQQIYDIDARLINVPSDRFNNVNKWMVNTRRITK